MNIAVNGKPETVPDGASVADLIRQLDLGRMRTAVEVNRELVPRARYGEVRLREGDKVEIVTLVGGG